MIIKRRAGKGFVQIPNEVVRDKRLSLDEHGMLHYLLSLPDDWEVNLKQLETYWKIGRDRRRRIFQALRKTGWAQLERLHSDDGSFIGARWIIGDEPGPETSDEALADDPAEDEDGVPESPTTATAAPERQNPDVLVPDDHETPLTAVGNPDGRVNHAPPNPSPLRRKTPDEERDSTNPSISESPPTTKSASAADDDDGEPPPRFGEMLPLWPKQHVVSPFACEKVFAKFSVRHKREAFNGIKPYLADCREKGHNRLCDLRTFLDERRWERFTGKDAAKVIPKGFKPYSAQWYRWREYRIATKQSIAWMDAYAKQSPNGLWTMEPTEWPPAMPAKQSTEVA